MSTWAGRSIARGARRFPASPAVPEGRPSRIPSQRNSTKTSSWVPCDTHSQWLCSWNPTGASRHCRSAQPRWALSSGMACFLCSRGRCPGARMVPDWCPRVRLGMPATGGGTSGIRLQWVQPSRHLDVAMSLRPWACPAQRPLSGAIHYCSTRQYLFLGAGHGPGVLTHRRGQPTAHDPAQLQSISAKDHAQHRSVTPFAYASSVLKTYEPRDLVGVAEIAERLGLGTSVVHDWRRRHPEFPQPVVRLKMGLVWSWTEVATWARETGRLDR